MSATPSSSSMWIVPGVMTFAGINAAAFSFVVAGAGHGWCSPVWFSLFAILLGPLTWLAQCSVRRSRVQAMCAFLLCVGLACDALLFAQTQNEGVGYVTKSWVQAPEFVVAWAAMWAFVRVCQGWVVFAAFLKRGRDDGV